jgi:glycerol-3-phosphate dehydrogenase
MDAKLTRNVLVGFAALIVASGCAGNSSSRRAETAEYQDLFERAEASIAEAERAGAYEHGSADLNRARDKLNTARKAAEDGDEVAAEWLAVEADLDADVALATARNQEMQAAVSELQDSIQTLQQEVRRNEERNPDRL